MQAIKIYHEALIAFTSKFSLKRITITLLCVLGLACNADQPLSDHQKMPKDQKSEKYVIFSPMNGVLLKNGKPQPDTKIIRRLRWNGNEEGRVEAFLTDSQGKFELPIVEEELHLGMLDQFVAKADLEVETETGTDYLWTSSKFHPETFAETEGPTGELTCDLGSEEIAVPMSPTAILTKCRWKNMPE